MIIYQTNGGGSKKATDIYLQPGYAPTTGAVAAGDSVQDAIAKIDGQVSKLSKPEVYLGTYDALTNTPALPIIPTTPTYQSGMYYKVTVAGNFNGVDYTVGDSIVVAQDIGTKALFWEKVNLDDESKQEKIYTYTDTEADILSITGSLNETAKATDSLKEFIHNGNKWIDNFDNNINFYSPRVFYEFSVDNANNVVFGNGSNVIDANSLLICTKGGTVGTKTYVKGYLYPINQTTNAPTDVMLGGGRSPAMYVNSWLLLERDMYDFEGNRVYLRGSYVTNTTQTDWVDEISTKQDLGNGFVNTKFDSDIVVDEINRKISIKPKTGFADFVVRIQNKTYKIVKQLDLTFQNTEGKHYVFLDLDANGNPILQETLIPIDANFILTKCYVANFYWNQTAGTIGTLLFDERHSPINKAQHIEEHQAWGTKHIRGGLISPNVTGTGNLDADLQFLVNDGEVSDDGFRHLYNSKAATDNIVLLYRENNALWRSHVTSNGHPVKLGVNGLPQVNINTAGVWSVQEMQSNKYAAVYIFAGNNYNQADRLFAVMGTKEYNNANEIKADITAYPDLGVLPLEEFKLLGVIAFHVNTAYTNASKAKFETVNGAAYIDFRRTTSSGVLTSSPSDIAALNNRVLAAEVGKADLAGAGNDTVAFFDNTGKLQDSQIHINELQTLANINGNIQTQLDGKQDKTLVVANQVSMLALTNINVGQEVIRQDDNYYKYYLKALPASSMSNWQVIGKDEPPIGETVDDIITANENITSKIDGLYAFATIPSGGLPSGVARGDIARKTGATWTVVYIFANAPAAIFSKSDNQIYNKKVDNNSNNTWFLSPEPSFYECGSGKAYPTLQAAVDAYRADFLAGKVLLGTILCYDSVYNENVVIPNDVQNVTISGFGVKGRCNTQISKITNNGHRISLSLLQLNDHEINSTGTITEYGVPNIGRGKHIFDRVTFANSTTAVNCIAVNNFMTFNDCDFNSKNINIANHVGTPTSITFTNCQNGILNLGANRIVTKTYSLSVYAGTVTGTLLDVDKVTTIGYSLLKQYTALGASVPVALGTLIINDDLAGVNYLKTLRCKTAYIIPAALGVGSALDLTKYDVEKGGSLTITYQSSSTTKPTTANTGDKLYVTSNGLDTGVINETWEYNGVQWILLTQSTSIVDNQIAKSLGLAASDATVDYTNKLFYVDAKDQPRPWRNIITVGTGGNYADLPTAIAAVTAPNSILKLVSNQTLSSNLTISIPCAIYLNGFNINSSVNDITITFTSNQPILVYDDSSKSIANRGTITTVLRSNIGLNPLAGELILTNFNISLTVTTQNMAVLCSRNIIASGLYIKFNNLININHAAFAVTPSWCSRIHIINNMFELPSTPTGTFGGTFVLLSGGSNNTLPCQVLNISNNIHVRASDNQDKLTNLFKTNGNVTTDINHFICNNNTYTISSLAATTPGFRRGGILIRGVDLPRYKKITVINNTHKHDANVPFAGMCVFEYTGGSTTLTLSPIVSYNNTVPLLPLETGFTSVVSNGDSTFTYHSAFYTGGVTGNAKVTPLTENEAIKLNAIETAKAAKAANTIIGINKDSIDIGTIVDNIILDPDNASIMGILQEEFGIFLMNGIVLTAEQDAKAAQFKTIYPVANYPMLYDTVTGRIKATDIRGYFKRNADNGSGADPDYTSRSGGVGTYKILSTQADMLRSHTHNGGVLIGDGANLAWARTDAYTAWFTNPSATGGNETRGKNYATPAYIRIY